MTQLEQHIFQAPPEDGQRSELVAFNATDTSARLDEDDFEERHGSNYLLRHHLTGCSQTLYTIDFQNDFVVPFVETLTTPQLTDVVNAISPSSVEVFVTGTQIAEPPTFVSMLSDQSAPASVQQDGAPLNNAPLSENSVADQYDLTSVKIVQAVSSPPEIIQPVSAKVSEYQTTQSKIAESLTADFNDGSLGGWKLGDGLVVEEILTQGKLHFTEETFTTDEPLLEQVFSLQRGTRYQFEMEVGYSQGTPPQIDLVVNEIAIPMEVYKQGDSYYLRGEFVASSNEPVNLIIMPVTPLTSSASLWLDNIALTPDYAPSEQINLPYMMPFVDEPVLSFGILHPADTEFEPVFAPQIEQVLSAPSVVQPSYRLAEMPEEILMQAGDSVAENLICAEWNHQSITLPESFIANAAMPHTVNDDLAYLVI
ncbi:hypothetical protein ACVLVH_004559 [Kluyvera sp. 1366]